jgi:hypothetical protein
MTVMVTKMRRLALLLLLPSLVFAQIPTIGTSDTQTLSNKTISGSNNTLSNIGTSSVKGAMQVLGTLRAANMNSTADQAIAIPATITKWAPTAIWATNCTGSLTLAAGGVYPSASKGGTALVAATQAYSALTGSTVVLPMTMAANIATTLQTVATVYFSLTTASGAAATCDIYILGVDLT